MAEHVMVRRKALKFNDHFVAERNLTAAISLEAARLAQRAHGFEGG